MDTYGPPGYNKLPGRRVAAFPGKTSHAVNTATAIDHLLIALDRVTNELVNLLCNLTQAQVNTIPFPGSWTPAQLSAHITKSNNAIIQAMDMNGKITSRNPEDRVNELKNIFLDFTRSLQSPDFIAPMPGLYEKENMMAALKKSNDVLQQKCARVNLEEVIEFEAFGQVTRLELLYFVLFHTQRHIHQLKKIISCL